MTTISVFFCVLVVLALAALWLLYQIERHLNFLCMLGTMMAQEEEFEPDPDDGEPLPKPEGQVVVFKNKEGRKAA